MPKWLHALDFIRFHNNFVSKNPTTLQMIGVITVILISTFLGYWQQAPKIWRLWQHKKLIVTKIDIRRLPNINT